MKIVIVLFSVLITVYGKEAHKKKEDVSCDGVYLHGKFHRKEVLSNGVNRPYQLSYYNNTVFFSQNIGDDKKDTFEIAYVRHGQMMPEAINKTTNGFATTVDRKHELIYFGGSDGVYVHNFKEPGEIKHIIKYHDIWDMFFYKHLYFIVYPSLRLHKKVGDIIEIIEHIQEKIFQFAVDGDDDIFITTRDGLYEIKNGTSERILYEGPKIFRALEVNHDGVAFFCGQNAIYIADKEKYKLEVVAHIRNVFGLTFDDDNNMIYSNPHEIIRLLPEDCK
uniref:Ommochrome-binding protein-like n=1 Tax=Bombyx mori TaxID=7091 RepID=A0A8R2AL11_BOMMO|nr:ommochrome-binding protein [Bombyx mori]